MATCSHGYTMVIVFMVTTLLASSVGCPERCNCRRLDSGETVVDCRGRGLTAVVREIPSDAVELDLGDNPIQTINRSSFPPGTRLRNLKLNGCQLVQLDSATFRNLQLLESLDLSRNRIRSVNAAAFQGLQYLVRLNLNRNEIQSLPSYLFRGQNLEELNVGGNGLQEIDDSLFGAAKIRNLNLDNNSFSYIGKQFLRPLETTLRSLSICHNRIALTVAEDAFSGTNLTTLSISSSMLINVSFLSRTAAVRIDLSGNPLRSIVLITGTNSSKSCQELILRDAELESLDESLFSNFHNLVHLDLSGNLLTDFRPELFRYTQELNVLDLSRNRFLRLPERFGPQVNTLETLDVSNNLIASLNWDNIRAIQNLKNLDLSKNRLQVIPENASSLLDTVLVINLSGNPWHCNCEMRWFRIWLAEETRQVGPLRCSSPFESLMLNLVPRDFICTPPNITFITPSQNVIEGSNVLLSCASQSDPAPAIVWRAPFGDVLSITPPDDRTRTKTIADWAIHRIKPYQSGWYSCNSTNLVRSNITYSYLQVVAAPEDAIPLHNLSYPVMPSKPSIQLDITSSAGKLPVSIPGKEPTSTDAMLKDEPSSFSLEPGRPGTISNAKISRASTRVPVSDKGWDDVDGYRTPEPLSTEAPSVPLSSAPVLPVGDASSERSASDGGIAAAETESESMSRKLIIVIVAIVIGVLLVAAVVVILIVILYRRRRHRKYLVKQRQALHENNQDEKKILQMSNLDDSGYSSTAADPLNPSKNVIH